MSNRSCTNMNLHLFQDVASVEASWESGLLYILLFMLLEYVFSVFQSRLLKVITLTLGQLNTNTDDNYRVVLHRLTIRCCG